MGKLMIFLYFILSVFPADATENWRHIHVVRRGSKKSHRGDTVAKIWIEENGKKKIDTLLGLNLPLTKRAKSFALLTNIGTSLTASLMPCLLARRYKSNAL